MSLLSPHLQQALGRSRLLPLRAKANTGVGERPSRAKGSGIEFADHRAYQLGDDIRHLDPHIHARLGLLAVREYVLSQQLEVTLILDASASMSFGMPSKFSCARELAAGLALATLAGGDNLSLGVLRGSALEWHPRVSGLGRAPEVFSWLEALEAKRPANLAAALERALPRLQGEGFTIVISDWLSDPAEVVMAALRRYAPTRQEFLALQVLALEEEDPTALGRGELKLLDSESGEEIEISLRDSNFARYREFLQQHREDLRSQISSLGGRFLGVGSGVASEQLLLGTLRAQGVIA
ncbi:MAG: DUF58 domain-containing protein [Truepera sp.]|nr:DUF58 domain-containing protein [Truepera sp.]